MVLRILIIVLTILYQNIGFSKVNINSEFNQRYLSNYFSAMLSYNNYDNEKSLKFFNSSKFILNEHDKFLKQYLFSLVENGQVSKAITQIKYSKGKKSAEFFEAQLLLILDSIRNKKFNNANVILEELEKYHEEGTYEFIIFKTLKSYNKLFIERKIKNNKENFGKLSIITNAFQHCYLNSQKSKALFLNVIDPGEGDYSRYLFFYISYLIQNNRYDDVRQVTEDMDPINSGLLILQLKKWIEESNFTKINNYFSCQNEGDLLGEFFYLIANLYSSEDIFKKSNFYLQIADYLNPKFHFNHSLLAENYFLNENYNLAKKALSKINKSDEVYNWYKIKKTGQIIAEQIGEDQSLEFIESNFKKIKQPNLKILYDMGNIYKKFKKYEKSILYYSLVLPKVDPESNTYADVLYRRGGSYERIEKYNLSDIDLLKSLEVYPEEPHVLNYLAYSWLERKLNIEEAVDMLNRAYEQKKNDPYIIDSVGWGYYLIGDYVNAEKFLIQAVQLMPDDPIVNDHYGDILWMLDRKLQAKYFWNSVLKLKDTKEEMKKDIQKKLIYGPDKLNL